MACYTRADSARWAIFAARMNHLRRNRQSNDCRTRSLRYCLQNEETQPHQVACPPRNAPSPLQHRTHTGCRRRWALLWCSAVSCASYYGRSDVSSPGCRHVTPRLILRGALDDVSLSALAMRVWFAITSELSSIELVRTSGEDACDTGVAMCPGRLSSRYFVAEFAWSEWISRGDAVMLA